VRRERDTVMELRLTLKRGAKKDYSPERELTSRERKRLKVIERGEEAGV
jgi:hypothetical protein